MALIVFLRGINVGGHRKLRPSLLARELAGHDVVNIGAAGTLVVLRPGPRAAFLAKLRRMLPTGCVLACCGGGDLFRLEREHPFPSEPSPDLVQFVSILAEPATANPSLPADIPGEGEWFVRIAGSSSSLVFGVYRRHMKTIGHLGRIDQMFGVPATTRSWTTVLSVLRVLKSRAPQ